MIKINEKLSVLYNDNSVFTDISSPMAGFDRGTATITFVAADDKLYVGFYKPISLFYIDMNTANTNNVTTSVKYYNGNSYLPVEGFHDDSDGLTRSGFIRWDRNQTDEKKITVNSIEKFWYEITLSADTTEMVINGINIVFSDDQDLKREFFDIEKYKSPSEASFILSHAAARDEIIQELRADGRYKEDFATGKLKDITSFDLLEISQVKLASTYLTMSKIMFQASDESDDVYIQKSDRYRSLYNKAMKTFYLSVDVDDDGKVDQFEELASNTASLIRR